MPEDRCAEIFVNGEWVVEKDPSKIKKGVTFRLFEPDGTSVKMDLDDAETFIASRDAYQNEDGIWTIEIDYK
jgi:1,4-alpha-glucan branching enzyme